MLEDELGVSLFERHRGGVRLTGAGRRFLADTRVALSHIDAAVRTASSAGHAGEGMVKIGVVSSISSSYPNRLIRSFMAAHPGVALDIVEASPGEHVAAILQRELDIAFVTGTPHPPGCDSQVLWTEPVLIAFPDGDPRVQNAIVELPNLADDHFIVSRSAPGPQVHDFLVQRLSSLGFRAHINHHRVGREALMSMVGLGFGLTVICGSEAGVMYPGVTFVPLAGETQAFSGIWSPDNDNPPLRRFLSAARAQSRKEATSGAAPWRGCAPD